MAIHIMIWCVCGYMILRMNRVSKMCDTLIHQVGELSKLDALNEIDGKINGRRWDWRFTEYEKVSFDEMVFKIWKPVRPDAFWDDLSFLEE